MKKFLLLCIPVSIAIFIIISWASCTFFDNNDCIEAKIVEIKISDVANPEVHLDSAFGEYRWSDELREEVKNNKDKYLMICLSYVVENHSDKTEMRDVRFHPRLNNGLDQLVEAYNPGNGTYFLFAEPNSSTGMKQNILIYSKDISKNEIYQMILEGSVDITYYTQRSGYSNGHEYIGLGKKIYNFKINDALKED
ncbi:MAG: hypothetical protein ACI4DY_03055 [Monoglobaceae bacterium]